MSVIRAKCLLQLIVAACLVACASQGHIEKKVRSMSTAQLEQRRSEINRLIANDELASTLDQLGGSVIQSRSAM